MPPEPIIPDDKIKEGLEDDLKPKPDDKEPEKKVESVPYHEDPKVQLYIERQIAKRLEGGSKTLDDRLARLEERITNPYKKEPGNIDNWRPANEAEERAAKAIIAQAKRELLDDFKKQDETAKLESAKADQEFKDWLDELKVLSVLESTEDERDFANLIIKYKLEDRDAAIELWNDRKEAIREAREEGEEEGIKKSQEAKIGSSRQGGIPGGLQRSYQDRRKQEPNMNAILERELDRLGQQ